MILLRWRFQRLLPSHDRIGMNVDRAQIQFAHLLACIVRAYESPTRPEGRRRAATSDGRITIALREPGTQRARLRAPHGTLDLPDFHIEVIGS